ncbi:MAG: MATE family efflux transporter, partial [Candidatus Weimeria sp.]
GHGSGSYMSRFLGARNEEKAREYGASAFWLSLLISTVISVICMIFLKPLLYVLGSTKTIYPYARQYAFFIILAGPLQSASCTLNNQLRYHGRANLAMIGLMAGSLINIVMDPVLMFAAGLGVTGAGLSTGLSQAISFLILLYMFRSGKVVTDVSIKHASRSPKVYLNIMKVGSSSLVRQALNAASTIFLNRASFPYGDACIAAMSIVGRIQFFAGSVMIGLGQGLQPVVSFNYGAGKYSRVRKSWKFTFITGLVIMSLVSVLLFIFDKEIIRIFRDDPEVITIGTAALRWVALSMLLQPVSVTSNMTFQSVGKAALAAFTASLRNGLYYIPLILLLPAFLGVTGIETAQPFADILSALTTLPLALRFLSTLPEKDSSFSH